MLNGDDKINDIYTEEHELLLQAVISESTGVPYSREQILELGYSADIFNGWLDLPPDKYLQERELLQKLCEEGSGQYLYPSDSLPGALYALISPGQYQTPDGQLRTIKAVNIVCEESWGIDVRWSAECFLSFVEDDHCETLYYRAINELGMLFDQPSTH